MLNYFIFHTLSLLVFWAFYQIFLKKDTFFERNRWYLLLSVGVALLAPFLEVPLTRENTSEMIGLQTFVLPEIGVKETETNSWAWFEMLRLIYFLGVAISLVLFGLRLGKLLLLIQRCQWMKSLPIVESKKIQVSPEGGDLEGALIVIPYNKTNTFSFLNYIFWNDSQYLTEKEEQQILEHELAHIKGGHSYDLIFMELQKIVFWFNPLIYLYQKELINQHEFIADSKALKHSDTESYISLMVSSLFKSLQIDFTHSFHNQQIKQRIKMLNTEKTTKIKGNAKTVLAVALLVITTTLIACSKEILPEFGGNVVANQIGGKVNFSANNDKLITQISPSASYHLRQASMLLEECTITDRKIITYNDGASILYTTLKDESNNKLSIATPLEKSGNEFSISTMASSVSCSGGCGCTVEYYPAQNNQPAHYACSCSPCKMSVEN